MAYKSIHSGQQIDAGVSAALNPDVTVTPDSGALVTSGAVAGALENIDLTITSNTDTTLNGILVGNGSKIGTKSLDTSSLTNDGDHVPVSSVVKSALNAKTDQTDLTTIQQTSPTCTEANGIAAGVYFYLDGGLVCAKTAIANGATFTLNTNYEYPSAGALNALKSALTPSAVSSFTSNGYTVQYITVGNVAYIRVNGNSTPSTTFDADLSTLLPFSPLIESIAPNSYASELGGYLRISTSGAIRVKHIAKAGWFLSCVEVPFN